MYYDDWHLRILPLTSRGHTFNLKITPKSSEEVIKRLIVRRDYNNELQASFAEFIREIVQLLIIDGFAVYEICDVEECAGTYTLQQTNCQGIKFGRKKVIQKGVEQLSGERFTREVEINRVIVIEPPKWIEAGRGFEFIIAALIKESKSSSLQVSHFETLAQGKTSYLDPTKLREMVEERVLRLTKQSGWHARTLYDRRMTEYYFVTRIIKYAFSVARLREYLIETINREVLPKLRSLGVEIDHIELDGLLSSTELSDLLRKVEDGEIGFQQAIRTVWNTD